MSRILARAQDQLEKGELYDALMGFKGYMMRLGGDKAKEVACDGVSRFCAAKSAENAAELAMAFVEKEPSALAAAAMLSAMGPDDAAHLAFLRQFFRYAAGPGKTQLQEAPDSAPMRSMRARYGSLLTKQAEYPEAQLQLLTAQDPAGMAALVRAWAPQGSPDEKPLFAVRPLLLFLAHGLPKEAHAFLEALGEEAPPMARFLLLALQRSAHGLFQNVVRACAPQLGRDPKLTALLDKIETEYLIAKRLKFPEDVAITIASPPEKEKPSPAPPAAPARPTVGGGDLD